ncbi:MAG: HesA/MoeB/ThiF family protein, partial [Halocynthiibacter sp.]
APALLYLSAAGVGRIGIVDDDVVDLSNLQRQVIHSETELGLPKVRSAACAMKALNTHVVVDEHALRLTEGNAKDLMSGYDIILDGCDNFATRYLVNEMAQALGIPLISAALSQWEGQISVYDVKSGTPCYQCIFPEAPAEGLAPSCAEAGVLGPLPGVVGAMMAAETVKLITGAGETLKSQMLIYDALYGETRKIALKPRVDCPICAQMR